MKKFVSSADFIAARHLLGISDEALSIEIGPRDRWPMSGVNSEWALLLSGDP